MECKDGDGEKDAVKLYCMLRNPREAGDTRFGKA
jgi:hypothetical protein